MKKMLASLTITIVLSLINSTLVFADNKEYSDVKVESQKKEIDNIIEGEDSSLEDLINYKLDDKGLSEVQMKDLLEYKSKASDELKKRIEKEKEEEKETNVIFACSFFLVIALLSITRL